MRRDANVLKESPASRGFFMLYKNITYSIITTLKEELKQKEEVMIHKNIDTNIALNNAVIIFDENDGLFNILSKIENTVYFLQEDNTFIDCGGTGSVYFYTEEKAKKYLEEIKNCSK